MSFWDVYYSPCISQCLLYWCCISLHSKMQWHLTVSMSYSSGHSSAGMALLGASGLRVGQISNVPHIPLGAPVKGSRHLKTCSFYSNVVQKHRGKIQTGRHVWNLALVTFANVPLSKVKSGNGTRCPCSSVSWPGCGYMTLRQGNEASEPRSPSITASLPVTHVKCTPSHPKTPKSFIPYKIRLKVQKIVFSIIRTWIVPINNIFVFLFWVQNQLKSRPRNQKCELHFKHSWTGK